VATNIFRKIRKKDSTRLSTNGPTGKSPHGGERKFRSCPGPGAACSRRCQRVGANARPMTGSASSGHAAPQSRDLYRHEPGGSRISRSRHTSITAKGQTTFPRLLANSTYLGHHKTDAIDPNRTSTLPSCLQGNSLDLRETPSRPVAIVSPDRQPQFRNSTSDDWAPCQTGRRPS